MARGHGAQRARLCPPYICYRQLPRRFGGLLDRRCGLAEQDRAFLGGADASRVRVDLLGLGVSALHRRPRLDRLDPALHVREVVDVLALAVVDDDPGIARHVRDGIGTRHELAIGQTPVEHPVEPVDLVAVAIDGVGQLVLRIVRKVVVLAGHRPEPAHLPEQPLDRFGAASHVARDELAGLVGEIEQDRARFEHRDRLAAAGGRVVDQRRDAVVGRHRQKVRLELLALADVHRLDVVGEAGLLEEDRDLVAVRRRPIVEVEHRELL